MAMAQVADQAAVRARLASSDFNSQLRNLLNQNGVACALTARIGRSDIARSKSNLSALLRCTEPAATTSSMWWQAGFC